MYLIVLLKEIGYTTEDIYNLPQGKRAELIDGQIYYMDPTAFRHQYLNTKLVSQIDQYISSNKGNCIVVSAPPICGIFKWK